jgi:WD40 repeat protein
MPLRISLVHQFEQQQSETWDLAFSHDGKQLVSSDGNALYLWQLDGQGIWSYERSLPFREATFPRFSPNGQIIAFGGQKEFIKLISIEGQELATFSSPSHACWAFSPDSHWLVSSDIKRDILLWDLATYQSSPIPIPFAPFDRRGTGIDLSNESGYGLRFTPDGRRLVFGCSSFEGYVHICHFDPENRRIVLQKTFSSSTDGFLINTNVISPDGKMLAMVVPKSQGFAYKQDIFLYDLEKLHLLHIFPQGADKLYNLLTFSPDSRYLASCKDDGWVDIFSLETFELITQFAAHPGLSSILSAD